MATNPDFIARLKYKALEEGGRSTPAFSGYRPTIKFSFSDFQTSGQQTFVDKEMVYPGETAKAEIKIVSTAYFKNKLAEGMEFDFREGAKIIGTGEILTILNESLRK